MSANDTEFLQQVKSTVQAIDPTAEVWLFGSRARGDARDDSDWDFLVLTEQATEVALKYAIWDGLTELEWLTGKSINPAVIEKNAWITHRFAPFAQNARQEGISL